MYPDPSLPNPIPTRTVIELDSLPERHYPHYYKQLGQSMNSLEKTSLAYFVYIQQASTPGFKKQRVTNKLVNGEIIPVEFYIWDKDFPIPTDRPLDLYLGGQFNFFTLDMPDGTRGFTQDGRFMLNKEGQLLTLAHQIPVLGVHGPIFLPTGEKEIVIRTDGQIFVEGVYVDKFKITGFENSDGLWGYQGTVFYILDPLIAKEIPEDKLTYNMKQGFYEGANEHLGTGTSKLHFHFYKGSAHTTKLMMKTYDKVFGASGVDD